MNNAANRHLRTAPRPWSVPELASDDASQLAREVGQARAAARDPAQQAIAAAQAEAAELVEAARAQAEQVCSRAREQGVTDAQMALAQERERLAAQLEASRDELQAERKRFLREAEPEILKLSFAIAEKVIDREVSEHPDIVLDLIRKSMKRLKDKADLRIRVNPDDLQLVKDAREELLAAVDGVDKIEIADDRRVGRGGCVIESPNGTLDARISTQLCEIERSTAKVAPNEPEHGGE